MGNITSDIQVDKADALSRLRLIYDDLYNLRNCYIGVSGDECDVLKISDGGQVTVIWKCDDSSRIHSNFLRKLKDNNFDHKYMPLCDSEDKVKNVLNTQSCKVVSVEVFLSDDYDETSGE